MAWLKSHQSLRDHPKTRKLARRLGVRLPEAVGILHCLWWWCLDYATDGDLTRHDEDDIAIACEWHGDPGDLIECLSACRFLDADSGLRVHDWDEYAGALIEQRERNAERMRDKRAAHVQRTCDARAGLEKKDKKEKKERAGVRATDAATSPARAFKDANMDVCPVCIDGGLSIAVAFEHGSARCPACGWTGEGADR